MKKHLLFVLAAIHFFGYMSCEKEEKQEVIPTLPAPVEVAPPSIPEKINTAPKVFVGSDLFVFTPSNDTRLNGSYSDAENNVEVLKWTKIAGPASFRFENEYALGTKVSQLEKGLYQFELAVTDSLGLSARDTIKVIVGETPTSGNEKIINDLTWVFPWYNTIFVGPISTLVPPNTAFLVYIRRENNPDWIPVVPYSDSGTDKYDYFVETRPDGAGMYVLGYLHIFYYGSDVYDTPDVKIVY